MYLLSLGITKNEGSERLITRSGMVSIVLSIGREAVFDQFYKIASALQIFLNRAIQIDPYLDLLQLSSMTEDWF